MVCPIMRCHVRSEGGASQREARSCSAGSQPCSLQLRVLFLGFLQNGDVGVGVFPEGEKVLTGGAALCGVAGEGVGASETEMCECPQREIQDDTAMIEEFLELGSGC